VSWRLESAFASRVVSSDTVEIDPELPARCRSNPNSTSITIELVTSGMEREYGLFTIEIRQYQRPSRT
jgi:hypothetical protein